MYSKRDGGFDERHVKPLALCTERNKQSSEVPNGFNRYELVLREAHVTELLKLEAKQQIPLVESLDSAIRDYLENRFREMIRGFHGT
jgi:hypothetical protein